MSEVLLLPRQAQSLHPTIPEMVAALGNAFRQVASAINEKMQAFASAIVKRMRSIASTIMDCWKRGTTLRVPLLRCYSPQTRAFLRVTTARQKHVEVKAKRRKRSARRAMSYVEVTQ